VSLALLCFAAQCIFRGQALLKWNCSMALRQESLLPANITKHRALRSQGEMLGALSNKSAAFWCCSTGHCIPSSTLLIASRLLRVGWCDCLDENACISRLATFGLGTPSHAADRLPWSVIHRGTPPIDYFRRSPGLGGLATPRCRAAAA